jgi:hypothetical protein
MLYSPYFEDIFEMEILTIYFVVEDLSAFPTPNVAAN